MPNHSVLLLRSPPAADRDRRSGSFSVQRAP